MKTNRPGLVAVLVGGAGYLLKDAPKRGLYDVGLAAATIDREHDRADRARGRRIVCPLLVLWSATAALDNWYVEEDGPIALWRAWGDDVQGRALGAGHVFPEEAPRQTAEALNRFFGAGQSS